MSVTYPQSGDGTNVEVLAQHARLLDLLAAGASGQNLLDTLVSGLETLMPGSICSILLLDRDGQHLLNGSGPNLAEEYRRAVHRMEIGPAAGSCGTAAYLGETVIVPDVELDPRWVNFRAVALRNGLRACWSQPITTPDGSLLATFAVYHHAVHSPTAADLALLRGFSNLAAVAIQHARLDHAVIESEERFRRCFEYSAAGIAILDMDGRIVRVNGALARMASREPTELPGTAIEALITTQDARSVRGAVEDVIARPLEERHIQARFRSRGRGRRVLLSFGVARSASGEPLCVCVNASDVGEPARDADLHAVLVEAGAIPPATPAPSAPSQMRIGELVIDPVAREVARDGQRVELTRKEFDLLWFLIRNPRRAFSRAELLDQVWASSPDWQAESTVTQHMHKLRHTLEARPNQPAMLLTVRGVGYRFDPPIDG